MAQIKKPTDIMVSERVKFSHQNQELQGYVCKKGRKYAYVVADDQREYKVPYPRLTKVAGAAPKQVQSRAEQLRAQFQANDRVRFVVKQQMVYGVLTRFNPKYACVVCDDDTEYNVPYSLLERASPIPPRPVDLEATAKLARTLMTQHRLEGWSFQFDDGTKRAGCCHYNTKVISLSAEYVKHASQADIKDTILHEIAHALVGKAHNHDAVWRAKAIEIGSSGERCHNVQFTLPRYIVTCENHCWVATAERRQRNRVCKHCRAPLVYQTYTEARWTEANRRGNG